MSLLKTVRTRVERASTSGTSNVASDAPVISREEVAKNMAQVRRQEQELPAFSIDSIVLSVLNFENLKKMAVVEVRLPALEGNLSVNDPRMGVTENNALCATCHKNNVDCPGHLGMIKLARPVYHPLMVRHIISVLRSVCNSTGRPLISRDELMDIKVSGERRLKMIEELSEKRDSCLCSVEYEEDGHHLPCRLNPDYETKNIEGNNFISFMIKDKSTRGRHKEHGIMEITGTIENPGVLEILESISEEDARLLGFENGTHPKDMILRAIPVCPPAARPPNFEGGEILPDHLTTAYVDLVRLNNDLHEAVAREDTDEMARLEKAIFDKYLHMIDNRDKSEKAGTNDLLSILQRVQGKEGLIRHYMMSKRVNFSSRTVIGPDPTLPYGFLRVPRVMAPLLTQPEVVTDFNKEALTKLLRRGRITHVIHGSGMRQGQRDRITEKNQLVKELTPGDKVERWLQDGDVVIFNRQPTLHKQGFVGYRVLLGNTRTFGMHLSYTTPHNADFDGDESNAHALQTLDARSEAYHLSAVEKNIMNAQKNMPNIGLVMDALTGAYLMTDPLQEVDEANWMDVLLQLTNRDSLPTLDARLRKYGYKMPPPRSEAMSLHPKDRMYPARGLFSALLPETFFYKKGDVEIKEGVLISGRITKATAGVAQNTILQSLVLTYGIKRAADFLSDANFIVMRWLRIYGLSVGFGDCVPEDGNLDEILRKERESAYIRYEALGEVPREKIAKEQYERQVNGILDSVKDLGSVISTKALRPDNAMNVMAKSGAKGNTLNLSQIRSSIGQQFVQGKRPERQLKSMKGERCLPYFRPVKEVDGDVEELEARGFCVSSLLQGLDPAEMVFHLASSRIGLTDTAVKTAETGHMHHKMVKALEDVKVMQDGSVRNSSGFIIQPVYGDDGLDAGQLLFVSHPSGGNVPSFMDLSTTVKRLDNLWGF